MHALVVLKDDRLLDLRLPLHWEKIRDGLRLSTFEYLGILTIEEFQAEGLQWADIKWFLT